MAWLLNVSFFLKVDKNLFSFNTPWDSRVEFKFKLQHIYPNAISAIRSRKFKSVIQLF